MSPVHCTFTVESKTNNIHFVLEMKGGKVFGGSKIMW